VKQKMEIVNLKNRNIIFIPQSLIQEICSFVKVSIHFYYNLKKISCTCRFNTMDKALIIFRYFTYNSTCTWTTIAYELYQMSFLLIVKTLYGWIWDVIEFVHYQMVLKVIQIYKYCFWAKTMLNDYHGH